MMTEERICGRCNEEYGSYTVFVRDDFTSIVNHVEIKNEWGNICPECRRKVAPNHIITDT